MKSINEYLNTTEMIVEADCKDLRNPRRGCTIYAIEVGKEDKVYKLKVSSITKRKDPGASYRTNKYGKTHYNDIEFETNDLGIEAWSDIIFGSINYGPDDVETLETVSIGGKTYVFGTSKDVVIEHIKSNASNKSVSLAKKIAELEEELVKLKAQKAEADAIVAKEITESLNND